MLTERGLRSGTESEKNVQQYFEPENSLSPEYSHSDWALTCAWLFASILLDMLD
jgi:hypothetical protein